MESADQKYTVIISDEATQMLVSHSRFLAQVSEKCSQQNNMETKGHLKRDGFFCLPRGAYMLAGHCSEQDYEK